MRMTMTLARSMCFYNCGKNRTGVLSNVCIQNSGVSFAPHGMWGIRIYCPRLGVQDLKVCARTGGSGER